MFWGRGRIVNAETAVVNIRTGGFSDHIIGSLYTRKLYWDQKSARRELRTQILSPCVLLYPQPKLS